jgi:hypothetical protein
MQLAGALSSPAFRAIGQTEHFLIFTSAAETGGACHGPAAD